MHLSTLCMTNIPSSTNLPCSVDAPSHSAVSCLSSAVFMFHCRLCSDDNAAVHQTSCTSVAWFMCFSFMHTNLLSYFAGSRELQIGAWRCAAAWQCNLRLWARQPAAGFCHSQPTSQTPGNRIRRTTERSLFWVSNCNILGEYCILITLQACYRALDLMHMHTVGLWSSCWHVVIISRCNSCGNGLTQ